MTEKSVVPALDRGLDVIECMASRAEALSLTEIAHAVERTVSEVQRTVAQLTARAYLVRDDRGYYRLSTKLFRLATLYPPFRDLVGRAVAPLQRFADATSESVHLCVLSDDLLLLIGQAEGHGVVRISLRLGSTQDPLTTVSGRVLLSGLSPHECEAFCERRGLSRAERARLLAACREIRERGYEYAPSSRVQGVHDLGLPVTLPGPTVIAAVTTPFLPAKAHKLSFTHLLLPLREAARAIAASYEPPLIDAAPPALERKKLAVARGKR